MKQGQHPDYGPVAFRDRSTGRIFLTRSTLAGSIAGRSERTVEIDGATYPVLDVDTTVDSHPFWTGTGRVLDNEGRVEAFERRYGKRSSRGGAR